MAQSLEIFFKVETIGIETVWTQSVKLTRHTLILVRDVANHLALHSATYHPHVVI